MPLVLRKSYRRSALSKAKRIAKKPIDKVQNKALVSLTKRLKKLETTTVERKYLSSFDTFLIGGGGQVKSRALHRYKTGIYDGMDTAEMFGTTTAQGDYVFARYLMVDVTIQNSPENFNESTEHTPTKFSLFILKGRKELDYKYADLQDTNGLDNTWAITNLVPGQAYANPKLFKVLHQRHGYVGSTKTTGGSGYGVPLVRYRFKIPINKKVNLQDALVSDIGTNVFEYPTEAQDQIYFAISSNGSSVDLEQPQCCVSTLLCYDDAGDN